ncbi:MAG: thiolase family protein [Polyangiaceae bacterium]|nr:thiolase family protein [Polyangiaceae bacterium]
MSTSPTSSSPAANGPDVFVVGSDLIKFGRFPDQTPAKLGAAAAKLALEDAGIGIKDIQAVYSGNVMNAAAMVGQQILRELGQTGVPVSNTSNACATGATAMREAYTAIKAGMYDLVLVVGSEQLGKAGLMMAGGRGGISPEGVLGSGLMPAVFGEAGQEHAAKYGTTLEQFAKVSVKNHEHSMKNPKAMYQKETPLEMVLDSEMIAYPNTKLMCSVNVDGAAAVVLASPKKARELGMKRAVKVSASILTSDRYSERNLTMPDFNTCTRDAAKLAYETAGIGPEDLDLIELHDCFAVAEILHYENLGLCKEGDAGRMIDEKETYWGGKIPVNLSGGLLSKGHPTGATGVANIVEIVQHLRGEAGARQCEGAKVGLTHVLGIAFGSACAVHVLEKVNA